MNTGVHDIASILACCAFLMTAYWGCAKGTFHVLSPEEEYREEVSFMIPLDDQRALSVSNINGMVSVICGDGMAEAEVTAEKIVRDKTREEAKDHIADIHIDHHASGDCLRIASVHPAGGGRTYQVNYQIRIPAAWRISVEAVNGDVTLRHTRNQVDLHIENGRLIGDDMEGNVTGDASNGEMEVTCSLLKGGRCALSVTNGSISCTIPRSTSAVLSAETVNGKVVVSGLEMTARSVSERKVEGTLGKGEGSLRLTTRNGKVSLQGRST